MSDFEEKYDYQEIMVEDISQIYQIANDYNSFYDLPRSGRGDPGDERTYLQAFYRGQSDSSWKITPSVCRDTSVDESISESGDLLFEVMAYNQHYIHATRLIDFTMDINVALFFACCENIEKDAAIFIWSYSPYDPKWTRIKIQCELVNVKKQRISVSEYAEILLQKYPESYDAAVPEELVYSGGLKLTDKIEELGIDAGKMVLSPTRTYAPVIKVLLDKLRSQIHGMVHCSGGAQTKVMHFVENKRVTKDNLFPIPPLFRTIQEQSGTDWSEMYKVFNMGHRMEIYIAPEHAEEVISISKSFGIDAQIVGFVEEADKNELIIESEKGRFTY